MIVKELGYAEAIETSDLDLSSLRIVAAGASGKHYSIPLVEFIHAEVEKALLATTDEAPAEFPPRRLSTSS